MKKIIAFIPNFITLCNLACGLTAIIFAFRGEFEAGFYMIIAAAVCDFCDGFAARLLNARSEIGLQLDSLSDLVSFGVAPAFLLMHSTALHFAALEFDNLIYGCLLLAPFAAYRLAVFNIDTTQSDEFRGLPTPAMALLVASASAYILGQLPTTTIFLAITLCAALILCILMVCRIPMFSFKFKNFSIKNNLVRYVFAIISVLIVILLGIFEGVAVIISLYILTSIALWIAQMGKKGEN